MISSRRLAREWALKILYQADVGKMSIDESETTTQERLRLEFVHRASRATSGSLLEEALVDALTLQLGTLLPSYNIALEAGLRESLRQIFELSAWWAGLDLVFGVSRQSFVALWRAPRISERIRLPIDVTALPDSVSADSRIDDAAQQALIRFLAWTREGIADAAMEAYSRENRLHRPEGAGLATTHEFVLERWRAFPMSMSIRWRHVGQTVMKQVCDWIRVAAFTRMLVTGVTESRVSVDGALQQLEIGWSLDRQVSVDRNILRMAAFELMYADSIPPSATINEAVELAKKYSTAESGRFVNGVLGAILARFPRPENRSDDGDSEEAESRDADDITVDLEETIDEEELMPA